MAVSGHLLILLLPVLSLCGATEYYVRPTEPTNTSCPAQPCLTLSQYTSDSDRYFKSNTVFKFLPGTHHMDRPVTIGNVHNMSLESLSDEYPHLVAQFPCDTEVHKCVNLPRYRNTYVHDFTVCCAAVWLHDVYNVTLKKISITVQMSNKPISGVILNNVSSITVQLNATCSLSDLTSFGVTIYDAISVNVLSSSGNNCSFGFVLHNTTNTRVTKVTAMYNEIGGLVLLMSANTHISNAITSHNAEFGMNLIITSNTYISNLTTLHNGGQGMLLSHMNSTFIMNTTIAHNVEDGLLLSHMDDTYITNVITAHNSNDGMKLTYMSHTLITSTTAIRNSGIGIYIFVSNNTNIIRAAATHNGGAGIHLFVNQNTHMKEIITAHNGKRSKPTFGELLGQIIIVTSPMVVIYDTSFTDVPPQRVSTAADPNTLPAVIGLYMSTLLITECHFTRNNVSAVRAYASDIIVHGGLTFSSNRAFAGTAFILIKNSILILSGSSSLYFRNNHATNTGGVFYITRNNIYLHRYWHTLYYLRSDCFFDPIITKKSQIRFTFANNSAGKGGDILYGGQVALGLDGDKNCLDSFMDMSCVSQNGLSLVSSDPARVCLCNGSGQPDCLILHDPTPHSIYPGQTITISAVVVGQVFGTVAGSVYAQFLQRGCPPQLESGQEVQGVTQHKCNHLYYTIFSQSEVSKAVLVLTARDSHASEFNVMKSSSALKPWHKYYNTNATESIVYSNNPVYVNISLIPCPPGFMLTKHSPFRCDCNSLLQQIHRIKCHIQEQTIGRSGLLWVGMIQDDNGTNGTVAASEYCSLDYCNTEGRNVTLSEPDSQCNYNHSGTLCGGCQPGLSLALGSARCLQCSNKYLALLIPLTMAGPVLVFSIKLLDLTISQGTLNGLIFYANVVKANEYIFLPWGQTNPLTVFIAWLNLDLGVETCLFQGLTAYSKTWLQFVFPFYIWSIAGLIIILARHSDKVAKVMGNNSVPVLATLFLLSHAKLLHTIITALSYAMVYTSRGPKAVWTADGNVDYLGPQHAPLFTTAVAVLLFLWLPYTLLLFLGQWLHRCNYRLVVRMLMRIKPFLDAHYGPMKSKHHYWFGALLLARAVTLLISALIPANHSSIVVLCVSVSAVVLTYFGLLVYRNLGVAMFDTTFFVNLALLTAAYSFTTAGGDLAVSSYTLIGVAFVQFVGLVLFKVFSILKQSKMVMVCLHKKQSIEDDWELYEQADIQGELESDTEGKDGEASSEGIESLQTH